MRRHALPVLLVCALTWTTCGSRGCAIGNEFCPPAPQASPLATSAGWSTYALPDLTHGGEQPAEPLVLSVPADWEVRYHNYGVWVDAVDPDHRVHLKLSPELLDLQWWRDYLAHREHTVGPVKERVVWLRHGPAVELRWSGAREGSRSAEVYYFVSLGAEPYRLELRLRSETDLDRYAGTLEAIAASFGPAGGGSLGGLCGIHRGADARNGS